MRANRLFRALALSTAIASAGIAAPVPAWALDPNTVLERLENELASSDTKLDFENSTVEGETITLDNVTVINTAENWEMKVDRAVLDNVTEQANGTTFVGNITLQGALITNPNNDDDPEIAARTFELSGMVLGNSPDIPVSKLAAASLTDIVVSADGDDGAFIVKSSKLSVSNFDFINENRFSLGSIELSPVTATGDIDDEPLLFNFGGFSMSDFKRNSLLGFELGALTIGEFTLSGKTKDDMVIDVKFGGADASNLIYPDLGDPDQKLINDKPTNIKFDTLAFKLDGKDVMGWENIVSTQEPGDTPNSTKATGAFNDVFVNLTALPLTSASDRRNIDQIINFGYERIEMDVFVDMIWDLDTGLLDLKQTRMDFADAGAIEWSATIGGYSEQMLRTIGVISNKIATEKDPKKLEAMNVQLLASMTGLSIEQMTFGVEDASLLGKVLKLQADQTGRQPEEIAAIVGPLAAVTLAPFQVPEFATSVTNALNTFMQGNKKITASIKPGSGLIVTEIIALASGIQAGTIAPADLIKRLNLQVSAE